MRILTICLGGRVRSVAMSNHLKDTGHDAMSASVISNTPASLERFADWAERIIMVEPRELPKGPKEWFDHWNSCVLWDKKYDGKRRVVDVGPDIWDNPQNPKLKELVAVLLNEVKFE